MSNYSLFEILFFSVLAFYIFQQILFLIGFLRKQKINSEYFPTVSIIVAARNEEKNILSCIQSLDLLDYPREKLQIIIVDDHSTDSTHKIVADFIQNKKHFLLITPSEKIARLSGKANAIANAIEKSDSEILVTTDADCQAKPTWIKTLVKYYNKDIGIVCALTLQKSYSIFTAIQNLDWVYLLTVASGTMNLKLPLSCIGNNMSYRKDAYNYIGGYKKLKFSVTEDFALLHSINENTKYSLIFTTDIDAMNISEPCKNWKELYSQKHRWGRGGLDSKFMGYLVMSWGFLCHLFFFLQLFSGSYLTLLFTAIKIIADFFFLLIPAVKLKVSKDLRYFPFFEFYFVIYVLLLPLLVVLKKKVIWKERTY